MKKLLLLSVLSVLIISSISSCRKKDGSVSTTVTAAFPTITFTNSRFFTISVGGLRPTVLATAYDSFYKESCGVVIIDSTVNNLIPGLYFGTASAKNHYGFETNVHYYVAVTNISDSMDLTGKWTQVPGTLTFDSTSTDIQKLARGLYYANNIAGVNVYSDPAEVSGGFFAVTDVNTIVFDPETSALLNASGGTLAFAGSDTTLDYGTAAGPITFHKKP